MRKSSFTLAEMFLWFTVLAVVYFICISTMGAAVATLFNFVWFLPTIMAYKLGGRWNAFAYAVSCGCVICFVTGFQAVTYIANRMRPSPQIDVGELLWWSIMLGVSSGALVVASVAAIDLLFRVILPKRRTES